MAKKQDQSRKKNLRRVSVVITAQTKYNLEQMAATYGYNDIGRIIDKLTREKMLDNRNIFSDGGTKRDWASQNRARRINRAIRRR